MARQIFGLPTNTGLDDHNYMVVNKDGSTNVFVQDQTSPPVDFFFSQIKGAPTTVAVATAISDTTVEVASAAGCSVGDYVGMFNSDSATDNRAYFGSILAIATNTITLDTPIDFEYQIGDTFACFTRDISDANGTLADPEIYSIQVGPGANQSIDITRIMISFITADTVDLSKFGDIAGGLTNGIVLRRVDGDTRNIWNVKNNGEIAHLCYDYNPFSANNPNQGQNGAKFRYSFAGQDKHGVAVRLNPGDSLQLVIQDNLTSITQFRIIAEGHYVID